ncbi:MAG TPA: four helix bundle protein [Thermodesulfobacteriota bacterium]|nr:four helix bundle protein [Thermodesulfobacteriota bacterium]
MINSAQDMDVFKLSHSLTIDIYKLTEKFPSEEKFGLSTQMRRSAYSIPVDIVEGASRLGTKEYRQFVGIARGSSAEISYQLLLSKDLGYLSEEDYASFKERYDRVARMLTGLIKTLKR